MAGGVVHSFYSILVFRSEKKNITGICSNTRKDSRGELLKYHGEGTWILLLEPGGQLPPGGNQKQLHI